MLGGGGCDGGGGSGRVTGGAPRGGTDGARSPAARTISRHTLRVLLARRAVLVGRVARDRDDAAVARAERVGLGELLGERDPARPPGAPLAAHDAAEAAAVAVVHDVEVVEVAELVEQDRARVAQPAAQVDRARPLPVDAARRARERRAARELERDPPGDGRHQRRPRPALPRAAEPAAAGPGDVQVGGGPRLRPARRSPARPRARPRSRRRRSPPGSTSVRATGPRWVGYPFRPGSARGRSSARGPARARRSPAA